MREHLWIPTRGGKRLSAMLHHAAQANADTPLLIFCHGFTGAKAGPNQLHLLLADAVTERGYHTLRFDFAGSGESEGVLATETTFGGWLEDLQQVIKYIKSQPEFAASPLYLLGLSMGGGTILLHQDGEYPIAGRIALAPVVRPLENFRDQIIGPESWEKLVAGEWIQPTFTRGYALAPIFATDLIENQYAPLQVAKSNTAPLLLFHGTADAVVPFAGSQDLFESYQGEKEFVQLEGVDHVFTGHLDVVRENLLNWLQKHAPLAK